MSQLRWFVNILKITQIFSRKPESKNREKILNTVDPKNSIFSQFFNFSSLYFSQKQKKKIHWLNSIQKLFQTYRQNNFNNERTICNICNIQKKNASIIKLGYFQFESSFNLPWCHSRELFLITNSNDYMRGFELPTSCIQCSHPTH